MNCLCSLIEETRDLFVWQLDGFVPQYLAEKFIPIKKFRSKKRKEFETSGLIPRVPLQMPGPATNSLVLSITCHPRPEEVGTGMSTRKLQWGVVREPKTSLRHSQRQDSKTNFVEPVAPQPSRGNVAASPERTATEPRDYHFHRPQSSISRKPVPNSNWNDSPNFVHSSLYRPISTDYITGSNSDEHSYYPQAISRAVQSPKQSRVQYSAHELAEADSPHTVPLMLDRTPPQPTFTKSPDLSSPTKRKDSVTVHVSSLPISHERSFSETSISSVNDKLFTEPHPEYAAGHCSFSASPVGELRPDMAYTGIRRDDVPFGARGRVTLLAAGLVWSTGLVSRRWLLENPLGERLVRWGFGGRGWRWSGVVGDG